ncbi:CD99 molecule isoform 3-T3 [Menidia menidia]
MKPATSTHRPPLLLVLPLLLLLSARVRAQEGFDLSDALGDPDPTPEKPKEPKAPDAGTGGDELDLLDAFGPDKPPTEKPKKPSSGDSGGFGFDLEDALKPDPDPKPGKPAEDPPKRTGGGGSFGDSDLLDVSGSDYKPDGGRSGGRASDYDQQGGADQPQDPELLWGRILKMLNAQIPEEIYGWISNVKRTLTPLLERALELLQNLP